MVFWHQWIEEVLTYTLVSNTGVSGIPYTKSQGTPPFGGRVKKKNSGGRGLNDTDVYTPEPKAF